MFLSNKKIKFPTAALILENGDVFYGSGIGCKGMNLGELCFNTSMTGYQEAITDPSYASQILLFTFPHIGITGVNKVDTESDQIYLKGVVFRSTSLDYSNWRGKNDIDSWLKEKNVIGISNINTRDLTIKVRENGSIKAAIINGITKKIAIKNIVSKVNAWKGIVNTDLAKSVTCKKPFSLMSKKSSAKQKKLIHIVAIDYGCKKNIYKLLIDNGFKLTVVPCNFSFEQIMGYKPEGVFLSNGPGDPLATSIYSSPIIKKIIEKNIPIFGICLGHQLLATALGAKTKKMHHGHHGVNQPVKNIKQNTIEITSQNHGFKIDEKKLPKYLKITHTSLFDGVIQGIEHKTLPFFSVQYHPESSPGPHDSRYLFDKFKNLILKSKSNAKKKRP